MKKRFFLKMLNPRMKLCGGLIHFLRERAKARLNLSGINDMIFRAITLKIEEYETYGVSFVRYIRQILLQRLVVIIYVYWRRRNETCLPVTGNTINP